MQETRDLAGMGSPRLKISKATTYKSRRANLHSVSHHDGLIGFVCVMVPDPVSWARAWSNSFQTMLTTLSTTGLAHGQ